MQKTLTFAAAFFVGATAATGFSMLVMLLANAALAAGPTQRVQEATIGQQDRSVSPDMSQFKGYDNSDFLRDMDAIARGTYIAPMEDDPEEIQDE